MALHDIDKSHTRRLNPTPNSNDRVSDRQAHGTTQNHNAGEEATADGLKFQERQIIAKQDGYNKAAFGFFGLANKFGLKVAKENVDVLEATDEDLIFNSEQNSFKIVKTGSVTVTVTAPSIQNTVTVPHGLGYTPAFMGYMDVNGIYFNTPYTLMGTTAGWMIYDMYVDSTNLVARVTKQSNDGNTNVVAYKYYLLQETAN